MFDVLVSVSSVAFNESPSIRRNDVTILVFCVIVEIGFELGSSPDPPLREDEPLFRSGTENDRPSK